jgi:hypothetical protein
MYKCVIAHYNENIDWVKNIKIPYEIYTHNTGNSFNFVVGNKANEATLYLKYILDNYNNLPEYNLFIHAHKKSTHQDYDIDFLINNINWNLAEYFNINKRSYYCIMDNNNWKDQFNWVLANWNIFEKHLDIPKFLHFYSCAQFMVKKSLIIQNDIGFYLDMYNYLQETSLPNDISGRIFEYMWHYIFTKNVVETKQDNIII